MLDDTHGLDACGVCGGDGASCLDCQGNPHGSYVIDLCGNCLQPTDRTFNSGYIAHMVTIFHLLLLEKSVVLMKMDIKSF